MEDIAAPAVVEVQVGAKGQVWVNVDGRCALRAQAAGTVVVDDQRHVSILDLVAARFVVNLRSWMTHEDFEEVRRRNAEERAPNVCHSHDFCDANVVMQETLENMGIEVFPDDGEMPERVRRTFNDAWGRAMPALGRLR